MFARDILLQTWYERPSDLNGSMEFSVIRLTFMLLAGLALSFATKSYAQDLVFETQNKMYREVRLSSDSRYILASSSPTRNEGYVADSGVHLFDLQQKKRYVIADINNSRDYSFVIAFNGANILNGPNLWTGPWEKPGKRTWISEAANREGIIEIVTPSKTDKAAFGVNKSITNEVDNTRLREGKLIYVDSNLKQSCLCTILTKQAWAVFRIAFTADGNTLCYWNNESLEIVRHDLSKVLLESSDTFKTDLKSVDRIAIANDAKVVWLIADGSVHSYNFESRKHSTLATKAELVGWVHLLRDSRTLLIFEPKGKRMPTMRFLDLEKGLERKVALGQNVSFMQISPDERLLAGCGADGGLFTWEVKDLAGRAK